MITSEKLIDILINSGAEVDRSDISTDKSFEELGLDSLDIFNFFTEIDAELGIDVPDKDFESLQSIEDVSKYLTSKGL
ncbi:phosphopantetheine-binding protein [Halomonas sp. SpR1]|uniref:acyl carrier protein n=1 Tax=Halomonas sp. SpR1 TaxID=3050462 RepID=UPI0027E56E61|nr:phosphopantetheine-binding protein [Halomonas sp. SpR1]MDQ7732081.1 phosphopantetheine-binding protein [Halomonas sp. SpR1]